MALNLIKLRADFLRRCHPIIDMTCFYTLWWEEAVVVFECFDCTLLAWSFDDNSVNTYRDHPDQHGTAVGTLLCWLTLSRSTCPIPHHSMDPPRSRRFRS